MDYHEFLDKKRLTVKENGFVIQRSDINPMLFDYELDIVVWALKKGKAAIFADCGLGKSPMQLEWAKHVHAHTGRDILILAPLAVSHQTVREGCKFGIPVNICKSQEDVKPGINITNYERLDRFDTSTFVGVVLDECFPPDTPIDVFNIDKSLTTMYIKDVSEKTLIYNAQGEDNVEKIYKRRINRAVRIGYNGRVITCSENHPFFTMYGWRSAQDLLPGDHIMATSSAVRLVRGDIPGKIYFSKDAKILRDILFSEMADEHSRTQSKSSQSRRSKEKRDFGIEMEEVGQSESNIGNEENHRTLPNEGSESKSESITYIAEDEAQTFRAWGKWSRYDITSANNEGCFVRELDCGIKYITGKTSTRFSESLQAGLRQSRSENRDRVGRSEPLQPEGIGQEEGQETVFFRVESVEVLEQGHPELEKYRDAEGNVYFYDLKAKRHPSYSVNGALVHNSSILKAYSSKTKLFIINSFAETPYKLACTATPSPNDHMEILNHAEFLDSMKSHEALAIWFINDTTSMGTYRLKKHAIKEFWRWVSSWGVSISKPSDFGYSDKGFELPPLEIIHETVRVDATKNASDGMLFRIPEMSATAFHKEKRLTAPARAQRTVELANRFAGESVMIWCDTNYEADELRKVLPGAVEIRGNDKPEKKEQGIIDFCDGKIKTLISKPSIFGFGLNLQHCHVVIFCGLTYSYESFYQATRRFWRFGQKHPVKIHIVLGDAEHNIIETINRKERGFRELKINMQKAMSEFQDMGSGRKYTMDYERVTASGENWDMVCGDCVEEVKNIPDNSIEFQIFSPPFSNLYIYSDSYRDMGNTKNDQEFFDNFSFLIKELYRVMRPGRLAAIHCKDLVDYIGRDGRAGLRDFPGEIIRAFETGGFKYHSRVTIWKDPVIEMQRTKNLGLLHKQLCKDSSFSRQGLPDYLIIMRKWSDESNEDDIRAVNNNDSRHRFTYYVGGEPPEMICDDDPRYFSINVWQRYASPVWFDIRQTNCLNIRQARDNSDEKHICPLQLDVIERAMHLWSNKGDIVYSPFAGLGSEGYVALNSGRRFVGHELKKAYFDAAVRNLEDAENTGQQSLFSEVAA